MFIHAVVSGRTPFMPVLPRLSSSYSYPPAVHCGMQQDVPNIGQLTTCLFKLMGEVRTIKNDLKRAKKKNPGFLSVCLLFKHKCYGVIIYNMQ
ncbi:hypothetical protein GBAR_LOCUS7511, partial [Geodia barretti]